MSDHYLENRKIKFKSLFGVDADDNITDFLKYVSIDVNREMLDKMAIDNLTESNFSE